MRDVFISHSEHDKGIVDAICNKFEAARIRCWVAPRDVPFGVEFEEAIMDGISLSKVMLVVCSDCANNSSFVKKEVQAAVRMEKLIIPIKIDDSKFNSVLSFYLDSVHWIDLMTKPIEEKIDGLVGYIKRQLELLSDAGVRYGMPADNPSAKISTESVVNVNSQDNVLGEDCSGGEQYGETKQGAPWGALIQTTVEDIIPDPDISEQPRQLFVLHRADDQAGLQDDSLDTSCVVVPGHEPEKADLSAVGLDQSIEEIGLPSMRMDNYEDISGAESIGDLDGRMKEDVGLRSDSVVKPSSIELEGDVDLHVEYDGVDGHVAKNFIATHKLFDALLCIDSGGNNDSMWCQAYLLSNIKELSRAYYAYIGKMHNSQIVKDMVRAGISVETTLFWYVVKSPCGIVMKRSKLTNSLEEVLVQFYNAHPMVTARALAKAGMLR